MQKAISPLIAAVILVAVVFTIGILLSSSFTSIFKQTSTQTTDRGSCIGSSLDIFNIRCEQSAYDYSDPDLIGYWSFDSVNATNYTSDLSGNANDGQLINFNTDPATTTTGKISNALQFDGVNDYVDAGNDSSLDITDAITIEAWVKKNTNPLFGPGDEVTYAELVGKGAGFALGGAYSLELASTGEVYFFVRNSTDEGYYAINSNIIGTDWTHLVAVFKGNDYINLYINGVSQGSNSVTTNANSNILPVQFGYKHSTNYFNGTIDEVRIYNRSLTATEILQHYNHHKLKFSLLNTGSATLNNITILSRIGANAYTNVTPITLTAGESTIIETNTSRGELSQLRVSAINCPIYIEKTNETNDIVNCN